MSQSYETVDSVSSVQIIVESFKSPLSVKCQCFYFLTPQGYFESKYLEAAKQSWLFWEPVK